MPIYGYLYMWLYTSCRTPPRGECACHRPFFFANTRSFWSMYLVDMSMLIDFRVSHAPRVQFMCRPQALVFFFKKHAPGRLEHVSHGCVQCSSILGTQHKNIKIWSICSNDYASKTRIETLCKKMCCVAPHRFSQLHFLDDAWDDRTLARMSTRTILGVAPTTVTTMVTSQQPSCPTAISKQTRPSANKLTVSAHG